MDLMDVMAARHSVRRYSCEPVPQDKLDKILKAAELAPSSRDLRPCRLHVVTDRDTLEKLAEVKQHGAGFVTGATEAIVVSADSDIADTWIEDSSIALTYMHLMAADQGVGSCWVQVHLRKDAEGNDAEDNVRRILGLDSRYRIVGMLALGIPE